MTNTTAERFENHSIIGTPTSATVLDTLSRTVYVYADGTVASGIITSDSVFVTVPGTL